MLRTITYRGPPVLVGALAHLLREEGVEFERPREDRTGVAAEVVVVLTVRAGDAAPDRPLDELIESAVSRFRTRFGDDTIFLEVAEVGRIS